MAPYWVISHPTRGWFVGFGHNTSGDFVPRYRWSISVRHDDVQRFHSEAAGAEALARVQLHHPEATLERKES